MLVDETFIGSILGFSSSIFSDIKLFIFLLIGLQIGFVILDELLGMVRGRLATRKRLREEDEEREEDVIAGILKPYKIHREKALRKELKEELIEEA